MKIKDHYNILFFNNNYPPEKLYLQTKSLNKIKKSCKKWG